MRIARPIDFVFVALFCLPLVWVSFHFSGDEERNWIGTTSFALLFVGISLRLLWVFAKRRKEGKSIGFLSSGGFQSWQDEPRKSRTSPNAESSK